jgi:hypothetical protein
MYGKFLKPRAVRRPAVGCIVWLGDGCRTGFVAYAALLFAVQVQEIPQVFSKVVDCVKGELNAEVCGVGIRDRDLKDGFSATVELAQQCFAVEEPGIRKRAIWFVHRLLYDLVCGG